METIYAPERFKASEVVKLTEYFQKYSKIISEEMNKANEFKNTEGKSTNLLGINIDSVHLKALEESCRCEISKRYSNFINLEKIIKNCSHNSLCYHSDCYFLLALTIFCVKGNKNLNQNLCQQFTPLEVWFQGICPSIKHFLAFMSSKKKLKLKTIGIVKNFLP